MCPIVRITCSLALLPRPCASCATMPYKLPNSNVLTPPIAKKFKPRPLLGLDTDACKSKVPAPSAEIMGYFDWSCDLWLTVDVETHELAPPTQWSWEVGQFKHLRRKVDPKALASLRVVQLGWTVGGLDPEHVPVTKELLVKPVGFQISTAAMRIHRISQEQAETEGVDLHDALTQFLKDVKTVVGKNGRVAAHNLEFDACVIFAELRRAGMGEDDLCNWAHAVEGGMCTMDPYLTGWCCAEYLADRAMSAPNNMPYRLNPVGLDALLMVLGVDRQVECHPAHNAGPDSRGVWIALGHLHRIVRGSGHVGSQEKQ